MFILTFQMLTSAQKARTPVTKHWANARTLRADSRAVAWMATVAMDKRARMLTSAHQVTAGAPTTLSAQTNSAPMYALASTALLEMALLPAQTLTNVNSGPMTAPKMLCVRIWLGAIAVPV